MLKSGVVTVVSAVMLGIVSLFGPGFAAERKPAIKLKNKGGLK